MQVLSLRDEHIVGLQEAVHVFNPAGSSASAVTGMGLTASADAASSGGVTNSGAGPTAAGSVASASVDTQASAQQPVAAAAAAAAAASAAAVAAPGAAAGAPGSQPQCYFFMPNPAGRYTADHVRGMREEDVSDDWRALVMRLSAALQGVGAGNGEPSPSALRTIEGITVEMGALCERAAMYKPQLIRHLMCTNCDTRQRAVLDVEFWRRVVAGLYLTQTQRDDLLRARGRFINAITAVLTEKAVAAAALEAAALGARLTAQIELQVAALESAKAMERLKEVAVKEHSCQMEFNCFLFKRVGEGFHKQSYSTRIVLVG